MPFYYDTIYWILLIPVLLLSVYAQIRVSSSFSRYSRERNRRGITGAQAAYEVLRSLGVGDVAIRPCRGKLTDHYDPRDNTIYLSEPVYNAATVAAVGVAAHEAGHAVQYNRGYAPIKLRAAIVPLTNIGSMMAMPLILLGVFINISGLITLGIAAFGLSTLFQLVTLPVELDASRRALVAIEGSYILEGDEVQMARKTLWAAAMTYVAALAVSLAQLLRLVLIFGGRNRD